MEAVNPRNSQAQAEDQSESAEPAETNAIANWFIKRASNAGQLSTAQPAAGSAATRPAALPTTMEAPAEPATRSISASSMASTVTALLQRNFTEALRLLDNELNQDAGAPRRVRASLMHECAPAARAAHVTIHVPGIRQSPHSVRLVRRRRSASARRGRSR